jgi:hypothetical protein
MPARPEIFAAIRSYATAYSQLQDIQERSPLIPKGDQKTGCIGEFYGYLHLSRLHRGATLTYGNHSTKGWDVHIKSNACDFRVQIKTVSEYSETRTISPIHHGWDQLWVIYLDRSFVPRGFWVITDRTIVAENEVRKGCKCPLPCNPRSGSPSIPFGDNRIEELNETLNPTEQSHALEPAAGPDSKGESLPAAQ